MWCLEHSCTHTHQCSRRTLMPVYQLNGLRQHNAKIPPQPTELITIQSLITVRRNCEKSMVLRTVLRKQCSKEDRYKCVVINLMCHMWNSPYATSDITPSWLGGRVTDVSNAHLENIGNCLLTRHDISQITHIFSNTAARISNIKH